MDVIAVGAFGNVLPHVAVFRDQMKLVLFRHTARIVSFRYLPKTGASLNPQGGLGRRLRRDLMTNVSQLEV